MYNESHCVHVFILLSSPFAIDVDGYDVNKLVFSLAVLHSHLLFGYVHCQPGRPATRDGEYCCLSLVLGESGNRESEKSIAGGEKAISEY